MSNLPIQFTPPDIPPMKGERRLVPIVSSVEDFLNGTAEPEGSVPIPNYIAEKDGFLIAVRNRTNDLEPYFQREAIMVAWFADPRRQVANLEYQGRLMLVTDIDGKDWLRWGFWGENDVLLRCQGVVDNSGKYLDHTLPRSRIKYWPVGLIVQTCSPSWAFR